MRTPSEPTYWSGNVLIRDTFSVQPDIDIATFRAAFPDAKHMKILWDLLGSDADSMCAAFVNPMRWIHLMC